MKSRIINTFRAMSPRPSRGLSRCLSHFPLAGRAGIAVGGAMCAMTLSGCYYPYGYYPSGYYAPAYATPPAVTAQPAIAADQPDSPDTQQQAQAQAAQQVPPATYAVAAPPPVYVAPAYPAYYPAPVYPAYYGYGYPGYYGPSVSIGIGGYWGGGWGHHWH